MQLNAYAKINLGLDVLGRRENGYHDLNMIMQSIELHDIIYLDAVPETTGSGREGEIAVSCNVPGLPCDERNLAYKAARLLFSEFAITDHVQIDIEKHIPIAAGLAGGSTDAAAVLKGINEFFMLGLSDEDLAERGVKLGADVPFCLMGGTAKAEGIGEVLMPMMTPEGLSVVLAAPDIEVSTKEIYEELDRITISRHPDLDHLQAAIDMEDIGCIPEFLGNVLEEVTIPKHPEIGKIKEFFMSNGAAGALMSGSGPSVYGLFVDEATAEKAYRSLKETELAKDVFLTSFYSSLGGF